MRQANPATKGTNGEAQSLDPVDREAPTLVRFCKRLGHEFFDEALLRRALTHRSFRNESADEAHDNERLEFLGDSVLGLVVAERLFRDLPDVNEGSLSRLKSNCVSEPALAEVARRIKLSTVLRLGRGERRQGGAKLDSVLADAMEAVLGAVLIDGGYVAAQKVISKAFQAELDGAVAAGRSGNREFARISGATGKLRNWKTPLQEMMQERGVGHPTYHVIDAEGPPHRRVFTVEARAELPDERVAASGQGNSKKTASHEAAKALFAALMERWGADD